MVRSPLEIIIEIFLLILMTSIKTLFLLLKLLGELFYSLALTAQAGIGGLLLAVAIGGLFLIFVGKFLFKETLSLTKIILAYLAFLIAFFLLLIFFLSI